MKTKNIGFNRNKYLPRIQAFFQKTPVKVLTGMRRVGKSTILKQLSINYSENTDQVFIDKDLYEFDNIRTAKDLTLYIKRNLPKGGAIFIDEVQEIEEWEKSVVSFQKQGQYDLFITGSNAHLLSSELATRLSGRYVEFCIYPLTFREFLEFHKLEPELGFKLYLRYGGLPGLKELDLKDSVVYAMIQGIYNTVLLKDVVQRHNIRNVRTLENICRFVFDNIGQIFSAQKISKYLKNQHVSMSPETAIEYLNYLHSAQVIHRVPRFDIKGKRLLEIHEKYFINDIGLRHALLGYREGDISQILENIVYLELRGRGYEVYVGRWRDVEIDFVASNEKGRVYIQVCYLLADERTVEREFGALEKIDDNYEKIVLSMDKHWGGDRNGIKRFYLPEWLLGPDPDLK